MENTDPIAEMDKEPGTRSPKMTKSNPIFTLDTHAMAYKLLLSDDREDDQETSCSERVSDYGKEARMDFYQNRSRSDGASAIMKSRLKEMRQRKMEEPFDDDENEEEESTVSERTRRRSSCSTFAANQRKMSEPSNLAAKALAKDTEPEESRLEMPTRPPLMYIPTVDSSSDLINYERERINDRKKLFSENRFVPYFTLPSPAFVLHCLLDERKICMESIDLSMTNHLRGTILIKRSPQPGCDDGRRRVYARRTLDEWKTHQDVDASLLEPCRQRQNVDRFAIQMGFRVGEVKLGSRLEFALAYEIHCTDGRMVSYWDNNNDTNYAFWYSA